MVDQSFLTNMGWSPVLVCKFVFHFDDRLAEEVDPVSITSIVYIYLSSPPGLEIGVWFWGADCGTVFNLVVPQSPQDVPSSHIPWSMPCGDRRGFVLFNIKWNTIFFFEKMFHAADPQLLLLSSKHSASQEIELKCCVHTEPFLKNCRLSKAHWAVSRIPHHSHPYFIYEVIMKYICEEYDVVMK